MTGPAGWTGCLQAVEACGSASAWGAGYGSLADAWAACERGDWMLWLAARCSGSRGDPRRQRLALCLADIVEEIALPRAEGLAIGAGQCIGAARRWAVGEADVRSVRLAALSLRRAAGAMHGAAPRAAARAAAVAASACYVSRAAAAAEYTAEAVRMVAHAVSFAANETARAVDPDAMPGALRAAGGIVRRHYPNPPEVA